MVERRRRYAQGQYQGQRISGSWRWQRLTTIYYFCRVKDSNKLVCWSGWWSEVSFYWCGKAWWDLQVQIFSNFESGGLILNHTSMCPPPLRLIRDCLCVKSYAIWVIIATEHKKDINTIIDTSFSHESWLSVINVLITLLVGFDLPQQAHHQLPGQLHLFILHLQEWLNCYRRLCR